MIDQLSRFTFDDIPVRGEIVQLSKSLTDVLEKHSYPANVGVALGEFMAAAALLSALIKFDGSLILQVKSAGQVTMLMAECRNRTMLRAIASYSDSFDADAPLFENGQLAITIDPDKGQRYQGIVEFRDGNLSAALEDYFYRSEQLRTRIWLASNETGAAGFLLQSLPESAETSSLALQSESWEHLEALSETITDEELLSLAPEDILHRLFHQEQVRLQEPTAMKFSCSCSHERAANSLLTIGKYETEQALEASGEEIRIDCQFCNACYTFNEAQINTLFQTQVH